MRQPVSLIEVGIPKPILYQELSYDIIGAAMEVHGVLGAGFLESVYETSLAYEFEQRGIEFPRYRFTKDV